MAKISTMFSSSKGNCTYISSGKDSLLVDVGINCKQVLLALEQRMFDPSGLGGIFITHCHSDHISGLRVLLKKINVPVYASKETLGQLILEGAFNGKSRYYDIEDSPNLSMDIDVKFFRTSHDCEGSGGYVFTFGNGEKAAVCTDLGIVTETVRNSLCGCNAVLIESNHDIKMLQNGPYPPELKMRIASEKGHINNNACAALLKELIGTGSYRFILGHLSENNTEGDC